MQRLQPGERLGQRGAAHLAPVVPRRDLVVVAAPAAAVRLVGDDLARRVRRQLDPGHLVPRALVVDQGPRAELLDGQEPGPLHVVAVLAGPSPDRDVGGDRQPRERIPGQEAFRGQVPVRVEVSGQVPGVGVFVAQQPQLRLSLVPAPPGDVPVPLGQRVVQAAPVLLPLIDQRGPVQVTPPVKGTVEGARRVPHDVLDPLGIPPRGLLLQVLSEFPQHHVSARHGAAGDVRRADRLRHAGTQPQRRIRPAPALRLGAVHVDGFRDLPAQLEAGLGDPDRVYVRADQVLVEQVQARRGDRPGHHPLRPAEVVLVVAVAGGAVGGD